MPCFNDFHIGSPAAVENTVAAIAAGGTYTGVLAQYSWTLPYIESDVEAVAETIKAIAVVAQNGRTRSSSTPTSMTGCPPNSPTTSR